MELYGLLIAALCLIIYGDAFSLGPITTPSPSRRLSDTARLLESMLREDSDSEPKRGSKKERLTKVQNFQTEESLDQMLAEIPPGLAQIFRNAYSNPGLSGQVLYTARRHCEISFTLDNYQDVKARDVLLAQVNLFKVQPRKRLPVRYNKRGEQRVRNALVSVHQVTKKGKKFHSVTRVLDSKLLDIDEAGWVSFDITSAVKTWLKRPSSNNGLEVWIESSEGGKAATRIARKTRVVTPDSRDAEHRPSLVMYFKSKKGDASDVTRR